MKTNIWIKVNIGGEARYHDLTVNSKQKAYRFAQMIHVLCDLVRDPYSEINNDNDIERADGKCICNVCGKEYREHEQHDNIPTIVLLCNGEKVKL